MLNKLSASQVALGGAAALSALEDPAPPQPERGFVTVHVGVDGAWGGWGLRVSKTGAVRAVDPGSVAASTLGSGERLRLVSVSGHSSAAYGGMGGALAAAAEDVRSAANSWKGVRLVELRLHDSAVRPNAFA